jgi:hypothetical protein
MGVGALLRSWVLEPDQLTKAKGELALGRAVVTGTRRGPRPSLAYPDRIVDVSPVFRNALFDGLSRYVEAEEHRRRTQVRGLVWNEENRAIPYSESHIDANNFDWLDRENEYYYYYYPDRFDN